MPSEAALRRAVATVCRRLWERGLIAGQDGNVSVRLGRDRVLVTPTGISKVDVKPADLVVVNLDGSRARARGRARGGGGGGRASTEVALHLRAYARRPDVAAVVHAHPPTATAFALAGESLPAQALTEIEVLLGYVPLVPYATPGTEELADRFDPFWTGHDAFLMANHGALTLGSTLSVAHQRMETLEHAAQVVSAARALGSVRHLTPSQAAALSQQKSESGLS